MPSRSPTPLLNSYIPDRTPVRGKVRDVYDFGDRLLIVATDRISAFDWILPSGIPDKGRVLTQLSRFWFNHLHLRDQVLNMNPWAGMFAMVGLDSLQVPHHLLSMNPADVPLPAGTDVEQLEGRSMVVRKTQVFPIECVVRGYLSGSGWKEYRASQSVCGLSLPSGLRESDRLPQPIFTPATKAETGHDENISFERMSTIVGPARAEELRRLSISIYTKAAAFALTRGIVIADTKFEFGLDGKTVILIDEVLTPDSSRFWPADQYQAGGPQPSFDKQFVRDWLETTTWDKNSPPPALPADVIDRTREKYIDAFERLTGLPFPWK